MADHADVVRAARTADRPSLREAAQTVVDKAEPDDDFDGDFIEYLVPFDAIAALRQALEGEEADLRSGRSTEDEG